MYEEVRERACTVRVRRIPRIFLVCRDCQVHTSGDRDVRIAGPVLLLVVLFLSVTWKEKEIGRGSVYVRARV